MPQHKYPKYLFVTGGVISGIGKGISTASIALLLKSSGYKVSVLKADMYLNLDAGTMNPLEHGEVFVTEDGCETDQDLGHYERFLNQNVLKHDYFTMGQVYYDVISNERSLEYKGKCVEGNVHIPQEIISKIKSAAEMDKAEIMLVEVGGTVGEYQNIMFFEAIRRMKQKEPDNVFLIHLVYLMIPPFLGEMKTKPAQASIYDLYALGLQPNFVICRSQKEVDEKRRQTISFNTGVKAENIIAAPDVDTIYKTPIILKSQGMDTKLLNEMHLKHRIQKDLIEWTEKVSKINNLQDTVNIAITGKYFTSGSFSLEDSYVCVIEAIKHAGWAQNLKPVIKWFDVEKFENQKEREALEEKLKTFDGIIVPQGWGSRGVEGKVEVVKFARENKIPYLGLCFGMQMAVIEYARNVAKLKDANSTEVNPKTPNPVVHVMPDQEKYLKENQYGGTIRLGAWPCNILKGSVLEEAYKKFSPDDISNENAISERHRHRYEINNEYKSKLEKNGLVFCGTSLDGKLIEAIELPKNVHPFFVATQFHPEYKSRFLKPHPLFMALIEAFRK
ncbi:CTP synthase [candidate division WWE3 bacterium RIFCSPLOWO2_12_FULL_36_10]|uniref:CTP synthase n=1 Tax=candidate division WWE3 bacterium RIFCSPLOWO2_12_FULL_36_10 TaxID=1802630 RepID=A0A1F4VGY6_UNCKA|nr:MAG: CTP synthase [candidate division WWE3 bacterium RIFCSPLOWO2_12_FULL_36_10]